MNGTEIILDKTDLGILRLMQGNARITNADIARELEMAPSAVLERVKKLEQKQVILQYTARINPVAINQKLLAFISMKSSEGMGSNNTAKELAKIPEVQEVHHIAGEDCYLVKVRTADSASLMHLMRNTFSKIPNILSTRTTIVLETVKEEQQLVIPEK
ncbi:Lrp/AsnC family transcriptional regulator [Dyadobacter fanqingshengii]|uniref:Lrp/AsnC family transcriptional regulator n=1 Tax=Dyadobacter fanqingshengii TaxID=2906443 RepID=A0A9X1PD26_9BACT|nr:Lrp/AsnC family transcriptional regulator [Dyadobacter fanqingshengii]MCF0041698.1 Lrp/AsnC family transcriptional regulator [Dyadobacter fanqingshengii]MCF2505076.1 Lrp/AsnC family transcriptional regulator [Dyadobacter fanqingshengii]USJ36588.1 Lrp/AsnC family transcriptional regulator [Dyadobacter fanqingshengii]